MKRGEVWIISGRGTQVGKPRPAVIIQDDRFDAIGSIAVCALTSDPLVSPLLRVPVTPSVENGLRQPCHLMIDRITTVPRSRMGAMIGQLEPKVVSQLDRALIVFLGLAARRPRPALR